MAAFVSVGILDISYILCIPYNPTIAMKTLLKNTVGFFCKYNLDLQFVQYLVVNTATVRHKTKYSS